jgi:hypothetical protein
MTRGARRRALGRGAGGRVREKERALEMRELEGSAAVAVGIDTGHFALEEDGDLIADKIRDFLGRHVH